MMLACSNMGDGCLHRYIYCVSYMRHNTRLFKRSLAFLLALLLLVKLLDEHRPNRPTFLSVLCNRARLELGAARGRARMPFTNVVFVDNVCLIQCGENLSEERRTVR
jgi:hypothetical protein